MRNWPKSALNLNLHLTAHQTLPHPYRLKTETNGLHCKETERERKEQKEQRNGDVRGRKHTSASEDFR